MVRQTGPCPAWGFLKTTDSITITDTLGEGLRYIGVATGYTSPVATLTGADGKVIEIKAAMESVEGNVVTWNIPAKELTAQE